MTKIEITTPRFERPEDEPAPPTCPDEETLCEMPSWSSERLRSMGLRPWGLDDAERGKEPPSPFLRHRNRTPAVIRDDQELWLMPGDWYEKLPEGFEFVDIFGSVVVFEPRVTDNDIRFGMLPFGILGPIQRKQAE